MIDTFLMVSRSSITMQSLGEIELRTPAVGAKIRFLFFWFVTLRVWRAVHSSQIYFEQVLCCCLWMEFDSVFTLFQK